MQEPLGSHTCTPCLYAQLTAFFLSLISPLCRPGSELMYGFSEFACGLNEPEEDMAPTDSRLWPDQRIMEQGDFDTANNEKVNPPQLTCVCHIHVYKVHTHILCSALLCFARAHVWEIHHSQLPWYTVAIVWW